MRLFLVNIVDAVRYALSDPKGMIVVSALMGITPSSPKMPISAHFGEYSL